MKHRKFFRIFSLFLIPIMLSSCVSDGKPLAQMTFEHIQAKPVYIASYEVINDSGAVRQQGFIGDPAQSITDYFSNRFVASGSNGKLIARVSDVKIGHRVTESSNSFGAFLGVDKQPLAGDESSDDFLSRLPELRARPRLRLPREEDRNDHDNGQLLMPHYQSALGYLLMGY